MIKVLVKHSPNNGRKFTSADIQFGLVSNPPERELCSAMFTCRDYMNDYLQSIVNRPTKDTDKEAPWFNLNNKQPSLDVLRLLIFVKNGSDKAEKKKKVFFAKKLLNIIEKELSFSKTSKITTAELDSPDDATYLTKEGQFFLITGPEEWTRSPHAISFVTFMFKSCYFTRYNIIKEYEDAATVGDIKKYFTDVLNKQGVASENSSYTSTYVSTIINNIDFFISKFNKIFVPTPLTERFTGKDGNCHGDWGIISFLNRGYEKNEKLHARYTRARDEFKKEKEKAINGK